MQGGRPPAAAACAPSAVAQRRSRRAAAPPDLVAASPGRSPQASSLTARRELRPRAGGRPLPLHMLRLPRLDNGVGARPPPMLLPAPARIEVACASPGSRQGPPSRAASRIERRRRRASPERAGLRSGEEGRRGCVCGRRRAEGGFEREDRAGGRDEAAGWQLEERR
jgi:hypothetical protein